MGEQICAGSHRMSDYQVAFIIRHYYYYYIKYCAEINVIITHRKDYGNYLNLYKTESKWVSQLHRGGVSSIV